MTYRKKRFLREKLYYNRIIEYKKLFHYENLLISEIDKIESEYNGKINKFTISGVIIGITSFIIPILGYTNDVIGMKIFRDIFSNNKDFIEYVLLLSPVVVSCISTFYIVYKVKKIKESIKSIKLKFIKSEFNQTKIFLRYISKKANEQNVLNESNSEILKYYSSGNKTKITFLKSDLDNYIYKYFKENNKNVDSYNISKFLSEIIISRGLIENEIKRSKDGTYKYIIGKTNIIKLIYRSDIF